VRSAAVSVEGEIRGQVDHGLLVFLGVSPSDGPGIARALAAKVAALRIFEDDTGRMNLALADTGGAVLCVSQFTLYGDVRRGNRPSFSGAAVPTLAEALYDEFCRAIESLGVRCERGVFGASMQVSLVNDGPVTLLLDSDDLARSRHT
jgi:D-tyrosyl-tRNA(Tyr) deacylase